MCEKLASNFYSIFSAELLAVYTFKLCIEIYKVVGGSKLTTRNLALTVICILLCTNQKAHFFNIFVCPKVMSAFKNSSCAAYSSHIFPHYPYLSSSRSIPGTLQTIEMMRS